MLTQSPLHEVLSTPVFAAFVGPDARLTLPNLIRILQEAAMRNTLRLGLSSPELIASHGLSWVIRRQRIKVHQLPRINQPIQVVTAPTGFERKLQTFRDFIVRDEAGNQLVSVVSEWLLMDLVSRRVRPIPDHILAISPDLPDPLNCLPRGLRSLEPPITTNHSFTNVIRRHQTDFNGHLTNAVIVEWMLDALTEETWNNFIPRGIEIDYRREATLGEEVHSEVLFNPAAQGSSHPSTLHQLRRAKSILATMRIEWEEKNSVPRKN